MVINFCKGSIADDSLLRQEGVFVEDVLEVLIHRLKAVNIGTLSSRETSITITKLDEARTKLEEARMWLDERKKDRTNRGVLGTYEK